MLNTSNLTYAIGNQLIIEKASLRFLPGNLYGLIGANGSGKSTLLKLLAGIKSPTEGFVTFENDDLKNKDRKWISTRIAFMGENLSIPYPFTAYEIVLMGCYFSPIDQKEDWVHSLLNDVQALHLAQRIFSTLSAGEQQRILIAQALATGASVLLLDEPTSHLDIYHCLEMWSYLKKLSHKGKTIIVSTHDFNGVEQICSQALMINQGAILGPGNFSDVLNSSPLSYYLNIKSHIKY
ncbi:hemin import ATP-binding protein HmuV [Parachlamydia acanthamoebae UV-7]|uniref:Hemin import ATP-binding protein HmuV n=2 Tax=Parachlamydia acanthamoebae TaxID=83552 RepID=F8KY76_PARAV|nr:ABC transporter ATP-binding protein [Parachlamydia acanthamoebae]CCB85811.1 hemin import ATP-binding protein HmuV [Parachlamydia acanthamoebae UV-7]